MSDEPKPILTEEERKPINLGGRPPRKQSNKVRNPIRFLVTDWLKEELERVAQAEGIIVSDLERLAIYRYLQQWYKDHDEEPPKQLDRDTTFDTLRQTGHV